MILHLDRLADRGCWISDDRVYALIGVHGVLLREVGFHGKQPVSKNSRLLVREKGLVTITFRSSSGVERLLDWSEAEWSPSGVRLQAQAGRRRFVITVRAEGNSIGVFAQSRQPGRGVLVARFYPEGCFVDVQGERVWARPLIDRDGVTLACTDRLELVSWLAREGPYAGDFLIPEPWRRILFRGRHRSGTATRRDVHPDMRHLAVPVYDAPTFVRLTSGVPPMRRRGSVEFHLTPEARTGTVPLLQISCGWSEEGVQTAPALRPRAASSRKRRREVPQLRLPGYPAVEEFFHSVPSLVESAVVRDTGVPRAAPGRYYWIWAWDAMVSVSEAFLWGEFELARRTAEFVNAHRDENGAIPARWTRSFVPMDTPSPGPLDFLLASLAWRLWRATGDRQPVLDLYPHLVRLLRSSERQLLRDGAPRGLGFYPDLPGRFGRQESGFVAMEAGTWHGLSLLTGRFAARLGDTATSARAHRIAETLHRRFDGLFWDDGKGFFVDAAGPGRAGRNESYPLFTLLFLHASAGLGLIRRRLPQCASFIAQELLSSHGLRILPPWDRNAGSETVSDSWYPHWDLYAVKILRRAGHQHSLLRWLGLAESVLGKLGYCPEFLLLPPFERGEADPWRHHGAPSNLNGVTAWYRALLEGIAGVDPDPAGLQFLPGAAPPGDLKITGLSHLRALWDITVISGGQHLEDLTVDGKRVRGCAKIPVSWYDGKRHDVVVRFGHRPRANVFLEITEAEVLTSTEEQGYPVLRLRGYGSAEVVFRAESRVCLVVDGQDARHTWDDRTGTGSAVLMLRGEHSVALKRAGRR